MEDDIKEEDIPKTSVDIAAATTSTTTAVLKDEASADCNNSNHPPPTTHYSLPEADGVRKTNRHAEQDNLHSNSSHHCQQEQQQQEEEQQQERTENTFMALNVAYEALEQVRQANVAIEFGRDNIAPNECILCLRQQQQQKQQQQGNTPVQSAGRRQQLWRKIITTALPCLACGNPVCAQHYASDFYRQKVVLCIDCVGFFSLDFVDQANEQLYSQQERINLMNRMLDVYDRASILLQYSSQFIIPDLCEALQESNKVKDKIGLGSSATGFVSGVVGVAAACSMFTPVGPPLLLASILFGGAGAATSASGQARFQGSSAMKAANTILTAHALLQSLARLSHTYRLAAHPTVLEQNATEEEPNDQQECCAIRSEEEEDDDDDKNNNSNKNNSKDDNNKDDKDSRAAVPYPSLSGDDSDNLNHYHHAGKNWIRATANVLKPLTLGVLSAASVVLEAREMQSIMAKIQKGSPCDKAETLQSIRIAQDLDTFPTTSMLAEECRHYFVKD